MLVYKSVAITQHDFLVPATKMVDILEDLKMYAGKLAREGRHEKAQEVAKNAVYIYDLILSQPRPEDVIASLREEDIPW